MKSAVFAALTGCLIATSAHSTPYNYFQVDLGGTQFRDRKDSVVATVGETTEDTITPAGRFIVGGRFSNDNPYIWYELVGGTLGERFVKNELTGGDSFSSRYERQYVGMGVKLSTHPQYFISFHARAGVAKVFDYFEDTVTLSGVDYASEGVNDDVLYYGGGGASIKTGEASTFGVTVEGTKVDGYVDKIDVTYMGSMSFYF